MADVNVAQAEADFLIAMEKHRLDDQFGFFLVLASGFRFL